MNDISLCKNCHKPIDRFPNISVPCLQWKHSTGHYGCNESRPMHSVTYAEPIEEAAMIRDRIVIALGNFMHYDLTPKKCFSVLADCIGMGLVIGFLGFCILS